MANMGNLLQILVSFFVEAGGQGVSRGGKGMLLSGMRKIGWAKGGGGGGGRLGGHRMGGHSMGSGFGGGKGGRGGPYNPKTDLKERMKADANRGRRSGSGAGKQAGNGGKPANLHGRSTFTGGDTLSGQASSRWVRGPQGKARSYTPKPRGFIKF